MTEEELQEEDIKIETLPIGAQQITDPCPVCMEQFGQFIKQVVFGLSRFVNLIFIRFVSCFQGDWEEGDNGQWHLHNAVKVNGGGGIPPRVLQGPSEEGEGPAGC